MKSFASSLVNKGIRIFRKGEKFNEFAYCYKGYARMVVVSDGRLKWVWNSIDSTFNYNNISLNLSRNQPTLIKLHIICKNIVTQIMGT